MSIKKNEQNNSTGAVQVNGSVKAPISINVNSPTNIENTLLDVRKKAAKWFDEVEGFGPPVRIGDPEGVAKRHQQLKDDFVTAIDRAHNEFPPKEVLYETLNRLKAQMM